MKVLLVEDNKDAQFIFSRLLKKNEFEFVLVENGVQAVEAAQKELFSLVLMDVVMPVMGGLEATKIIREMPGYAKTPIVVVTALTMRGDREECLKTGATDYVPKPIDNRDFIEMVKKYTSDLSK